MRGTFPGVRRRDGHRGRRGQRRRRGRFAGGRKDRLRAARRLFRDAAGKLRPFVPRGGKGTLIVRAYLRYARPRLFL